MSADTVTLEFTRDELRLVSEALQTVLNCRRYSFRENDESIGPYGIIQELVSRIELQAGRGSRTASATS